MRLDIIAAQAFIIMFLAPPAVADIPKELRIEAVTVFSRTEQQVKTEVGGARGERLVEDTALGMDLNVSYDIQTWLAAGMFLQTDIGRRSAGRFVGFDPDGMAMIEDTTGGSYAELWLGPLVRARWRMLFGELGYGLLAIRRDSARGDLASESGDTSSAFTTLPTVSWRMAVGVEVPLTRRWEAVFRLTWRIRYYDERGGSPLADEMVHGTQTFQPFVGLVWRPGRVSR